LGADIEERRVEGSKPGEEEDACGTRANECVHVSDYLPPPPTTQGADSVERESERERARESERARKREREREKEREREPYKVST
jgi:hypothetical protein